MAADDALAIARTYHDAWTNKDFDMAVSLLASDLSVEVPINDYPTTESFASALRGFGSMAADVKLVSQMSAGDEATLLYDM